MELHEELLDDAEAAERADHGGTLRLIAATGARIRRAAALREFDPMADEALRALAGEGRPRALIVIGYGTGATVARLLTAVAGAAATVPIVSVPGPALPGWVGPLDLVVVASTAGRAPEISAALAEAGRRGCRIIAVAPTISPIGDLCKQIRGTLIAMADDVAPVWSRLWSIAVPTFIAAETAGVIPPQRYDAAASAADEAAIRCRPSQEPFVNPAKEIALRFAESAPAVWASGQVAAVAAERMADQAALRAGLPVTHAALPDLGRGQFGLLDGPLAAGSGDIFRDPFEDGVDRTAAVVLLAEDGVDPRLSVVENLVRDRGIPLTVLTAEQPDPLARAAHLIAVADFAAAYLALLVGSGPDQGRTIDEYRLRTAQ
ncbi:MAG TPA: SIS domain-containing protein [Actinocrinis sp.]|uniref:SIS domain-containing protein n=1 Tax=Actinocrinis sp. TaxID=1920516 RepID=UPI002DDCB420|nr:SIS domain-containing protein [Actinocrinis sp.]HEV2347721.1 SIS domain-containing protein [Actinocrinis sp.]